MNIGIFEIVCGIIISSWFIGFFIILWHDYKDRKTGNSVMFYTPYYGDLEKKNKTFDK